MPSRYGDFTPMHVEIVTHCWRYSSLLFRQGSSLLLHPPKQDVRVTLTVYCSAEDSRTCTALDRLDDENRASNIEFDRRELPTPRLMRRAIGRNLAARTTKADIVWFADCDMLFRSETFSALKWEIIRKPDGMLYYPKRVLVSVDHDAGDREIERAKAMSCIADVDESMFVAKRYRRAIGGAQIVRGDVAREYGYVPIARFQRPAKHWQRAVEDVHFRKLLGPPQYAIDVPGVFRIRHSRCGRNDLGCEL